MVQHFIKCLLAPSTQNTYTSAKKRYTQFCQHLNVSPLPVSENVLCHYVAHLAQEGLKHTSIKTYLSAIRHAQILAGQGDPFQTPFPLLEYMFYEASRVNKRGRVSQPHGPSCQLPQRYCSNFVQYGNRPLGMPIILCYG